MARHRAAIARATVNHDYAYDIDALLDQFGHLIEFLLAPHGGTDDLVLFEEQARQIDLDLRA